jgi:hypothetical protein
LKTKHWKKEKVSNHWDIWTGKSTASDLKYKKSKIRSTNCTTNLVSSRILKYSTEWRNGV